MMLTTKALRRRVWRLPKESNWPYNHFNQDRMKEDFFEEEWEEMNKLRKKILDKAIAMGYDPEEDLVQ